MNDAAGRGATQRDNMTRYMTKSKPGTQCTWAHIIRRHVGLSL